MTKLVNTDELAKQLGVSPMTVFRLREKGLPTIKVGNSVRFDLNDVIEWMKRGGEEKHG
jgi:excisionase family DNA binding protein